MLAQDQSTDYSSEFEQDGLNSKGSSSTQDTSVLSIKHINKATDNSVDKQFRELEELAEDEEEPVQSNKKRHSSKEELIKWAAKLELESLSVKEMMKGDMRFLLDQNYQFLISSYKETNRKLSEIDKRLVGVTESQRRRDTSRNKKIQDDISQGIIEKILPEINALLADEVHKNLRQFQTRIDSIHKDVEKSRREQESIIKSIKRIESHITSHFRHNEQGSNKIDSHFFNSQQSLGDIKQYLKLLLPKLIAMEKTFLQLASSYTNISTSLKNTDEEAIAEQSHAEGNKAFEVLIRRNRPKKRKLT